MMRSFVFLAALLFPLPGVAAQSAQASSAVVVSTPPGRSCELAELPGDLPVGNEVLDSAALIGPLSSTARMLLTLRFEDAGRRASVAVLETDRDSAVNESLRAGIQAAVRLPQKGIKSVWAIRLRVVGGLAPVLTIERSVFCSVKPRSQVPTGIVTIITEQDTTRIVDSTVRARPQRQQRVQLAGVLHISARGEITEVMLTSSSSEQETEQFSKQWRRIRFLPALLDGFPVAVRYDTESERSTPE